jgi:filamentous hemagglutinin family protein
MNRSYRTIWNDEAGTFVAASEKTKSDGGKLSLSARDKSGFARFALKTLAASVMLAVGVNGYAAPTGGVVAAGSATIAGSTGNTTITQSSQNVAINWQSFNIGTGEAVRFVQPNASSVALNRVLGPDPSSILGSLSANGKVFLVNPNGILFGQGAQVNVGGLVASTRNITDSDFMAGIYKFSGNGGGAILNRGSINADGGYVALLGASVSNEGVISARLGTVALAAGNAFTLDVAGDGLLNVVVNEGALNALVQNGGMIKADGGQVLLTAQAAGVLLQSAVNNTGVIEAQTIDTRSGSIKLLADMQSGTVTAGGTLDASAPNGGNGGFVETSAAHVNVPDNARVTTLARDGLTGTWLIDPTDYTIAVAGGDITGLQLATNLMASNITISSNDGLVGSHGDIHVNTPVNWASATTLTLNAVHDVLVDAAITAVTAGAKLRLIAGHDVATTSLIDVVAAGSTVTINAVNDVRIGGAITATAANSAINISGGQNVTTTAALHTVAAASEITLSAGLDLSTGGAILATAAASSMIMTAGRDVTASAAITAVAAGSTIRITAGRDATNTTTGAFGAGAATSTIEMNAGRNVNVNAAIAAGAAGSTIRLIAGLNGIGPGAANGTVTLAGAVAAPSVTIRFNPNGYANTASEIALYPALADAKAWVYVQGGNKTYDGTTAAALAFNGTPASGGAVFLTPGTAAFGSKDAGTAKAIAFNGYGLGGADSGRFALFASAGTTSADIAKRPLVLSATGTDKTYSGTTADTVTLADNRIAGDVLTPSYNLAAFADKNVGTAKTVSVSGIALTGADAANYTVNSSIATTASIIPAPLTITASNVWKNYGQTPVLSAFATAGLVNGETVGGVALTSPGTSASAGVSGSPYAITPGNAAGGTFTASNYTIRYVNGTMTVVPVGLTVTAANDTKFFGETSFDSGFIVVGLVNGETVGAFTLTSAGAPANASVAGSPYPIRLSPASGGTFTASNYSIVYVNGLLTVLPVAVAQPIIPGQLTTVIAPVPPSVTPLQMPPQL